MLQAWTADFDYKLQRLSSAHTEVFSPFFANLPLDPYIEGTFRRRRFSRFQGEPENLTRLEHKYFEQSSSVNKLAGGVKRDFAELEEDLVRLPEFQVLVSRFVDFLKLNRKPLRSASTRSGSSLLPIRSGSRHRKEFTRTDSISSGYSVSAANTLSGLKPIFTSIQARLRFSQKNCSPASSSWSTTANCITSPQE